MTFQPILLAHAARYPAWQPQDVYKLCHQAAMGSEHAVLDRERARAWLQQELASLTDPRPDLSDEPLIDPISEDGSIARVHLRPLVHLGLPPGPLLEAFLRTSEEYRGSTTLLNDYLQQAINLETNFTVRQLMGYFVHRASEGFPGVHHSEAYIQAYRPVYRVVLLSTLPRDWITM